MNVILSGGGTAGHINPALALAEVLQEDGHVVRFAGTPTGVESRLVPEAGIPFKGFDAAGFNRNHPTTIFRALRLMSHSTKQALQWFGEVKPDVVVGFGGYVSIPVGRAAEESGIPLVVHEQNSVMGMANKHLAKKAVSVCLTYDVAGSEVADKSKLVLTGNPVRSSVFKATRLEGRSYLNIPDDAHVLLVFGGSLGARHLNTAMAALKAQVLERPDLYVVHITGPKEFETVKEQLNLTADEQKRWIIKDYEHRMGSVLAATDMVVSRAGATSLAEISGLQIPAVLVPFPYATADHQTINAREYVERGAAFMVADDKVEEPVFGEKLFEMVDGSDVRENMRRAARTFETKDAARKLADVVIAAAKRK